MNGMVDFAWRLYHPESSVFVLADSSSLWQELDRQSFNEVSFGETRCQSEPKGVRWWHSFIRQPPAPKPCRQRLVSSDSCQWLQRWGGPLEVSLAFRSGNRCCQSPSPTFRWCRRVKAGSGGMSRDPNGNRTINKGLLMKFHCAEVCLKHKQRLQ